MSHRFRLFGFIVLTSLIVVLLMGPPLAIASKLPTICNIFYKDQMDKSRHCGQQSVFSKIQHKTFEFGAVFVSNTDLEIHHFLVPQTIYPTFFLSIGDFLQSNPLRC